MLTKPMDCFVLVSFVYRNFKNSVKNKSTEYMVLTKTILEPVLKNAFFFQKTSFNNVQNNNKQKY